jgi:hypothetical protein
MIFPHHNIHKYTWMSPDGKSHNEMHSNTLDVQSCRAADCDTDRFLVVAKVRERLAVNKQRSHRFHMERLNLKKVNEV